MLATRKRLSAASAALLLSLTFAACGQDSGPTPPAPSAGRVEQKQAAPATPKPEEKPDPDDPQVTGLPRTDYDGSGPSGIYKGVPPTPPDPADFPGMNENTDAGAIQTLKYWDTAYNYAIATGDVGRLRQYSAQECSKCTESIDLIINKHKEGTYGKGGVYEFEKSEIDESDKIKAYYIHVKVKNFSVVTRDRPSPSENRPSIYVRGAYMKHDGEQWLVTDIDYASAKA
ncbi:DUF6318 family protein [Dermabacteraceae bacterium P9123]